VPVPPGLWALFGSEITPVSESVTLTVKNWSGRAPPPSCRRRAGSPARRCAVVDRGCL